jgi:hypothetical protein
MTRLPCTLAALLLASSCLTARGGGKGIVDGDKAITSDATNTASAISWEIQSAFSAVGGSEFVGLTETHNVEALDTFFGAIASIQLRDGFLPRFGLELQRFDFSRPSATPLPYCLNSIAAVVGADFQIGSDWLGRIDFKPGLYGSDNELRARDFNAPIELGISYLVSADLQIVVGAGVDINRKYPVIPVVGLRWKFAPDWVLNAVLPAPRLEYSATTSLTLYAGAAFQGDTYRVSDVSAHTRRERKLNNAVVDYTQIRVGAGTTWSINQHLKLEVEAGFVPVHEFDFHRADTRLRSKEVPPYAGISLKAEF